MFHVVFCILLLVINMQAVMEQLLQLGKSELICLLTFTCNYVVSSRRGFLFLLVLWIGCVILLWHSLGLQYNYFGVRISVTFHIMFVHNSFSSVCVVAWPPFGKDFGWPSVFIVYCLLVILVISRFGFEGGFGF